MAEDTLDAKLVMCILQCALSPMAAPFRTSFVATAAATRAAVPAAILALLYVSLLTGQSRIYLHPHARIICALGGSCMCTSMHARGT